MSVKLRTVIVGAGNISGMKSMAVNLKPVVTHIQAIIEKKDSIELVGIVDKHITKVYEFQDKWGFSSKSIAANSITSLRSYESDVDFFIVATNPESHKDIVSEIFNSGYRPKIILLEKPGGDGIDEALYIDCLCKTFDCKLYVNYQRNYIFKKELFQRIGKVKSIECHYVRGLLNDASHAIAFILNLFGNQHEFSSAKQSVSFNSIFDKSGDPTISTFFRISGINVILIGHDGRDYDVFEMRFWGTDGTITIDNHGSRVSVNTIKFEEIYGEYKTLSSSQIFIGNVCIELSNVYERIICDNDCDQYNPCVDYIGIWHFLHNIQKNYLKGINHEHNC